MRVTIHIAKPFFITKEQKETKVTVPRILAQNSLTDNKTKKREVVTIIKKPKKPECIVNTLTFKDVHPNDVENTISNVRSKYGIKLKKKKEMVFVHPHSSNNLPKLCNTIQNYCDRIKKEGLERN
jgi:hypothetical protein